MREANTVPVQRLDYAPPAYFIRSVDLVFDLDPAKTIVASRLEIERNPALAAQALPLRLQGEALNLLRVLIDGQSVSFRHEGDELVIDSVPAKDRFTLEIRNTCAPDKNSELLGLYTSGGGFFTQCEAEGFRRITYFLDRPDVMAVYTVTLKANQAAYPVLLSNGNLVEQGELPAGRHFAKWHDPHPKPSYLFALVAGQLAAREQRIKCRSGAEHLLQIYVRPQDLDKTEHAMQALVASVVWDEARFGLALDLERYMVVAVEDFNSGAMENKGLNIFNTALLLANASNATDADFAAVEGVIAHEYFHNWTGNRVTCRDWFQLSLKEGLTVFRDQEFSMDMTGLPTGGIAAQSARAVKRIQDVRRLRNAQFPEDAGPMAHPVRPDSYLEINNFYTATVYEKGAEVVRMMHTLVGREGFADGMRLYFERHDGQAVTCDDFAQAMADANPGSELSGRLEPFKRWYAQAGTPRVTAHGSYDAQAASYTLRLAQKSGVGVGAAQGHQQPFVIPLQAALFAADGQPLASERLLVLDQAEQSFVFADVQQEPVLSLGRGFSAPVWLDDGLREDQHLVLLAHDSDPFNRFEAGQKLVLARLLQAIQHVQAPMLGEGMLSALRSVLRHPHLAPALKELSLSIPSTNYLSEQLPSVDPQRVHQVREQWRLMLAQELHADWVWAFETHQTQEGYRPNAEQAGARSLANMALHMLCLNAVRQGDPVWPGRAYQRVKSAGNMTDRAAALSALLSSHSELCSAALAHFHASARGEALVLDRWFALQATAPEAFPAIDGDSAGGRGSGSGSGSSTSDSSFARAQQLLKHPDFSLKNPNRVRSLLSALCSANPSAFHRADGSGYRLWAEQLQALDAINGHVAGRLARAMDRWAHLSEPYRSQAHRAIQQVADNPKLSNDVREVLTRALQPA